MLFRSCESEFKGHDLIPRAVVAAGVLFGILGLGSYLKSGNAEPRIARLAQAPIERPAAAPQSGQLPANVIAPTPAVPPPSQIADPAPPVQKLTAAPVAPPKTQLQDVVYMCGAQTKKGTPCSRRVHGPVRCYQHLGMPPMVAQEKLKIN